MSKCFSAQRPTVAVAGSMAQLPRRGGHSWVFMQYLLGLRRLGFDVLFIDSLTSEMCLNADGMPSSVETSHNAVYLADLMRWCGLQDSFALLHDGGGRSLGLSREELLRRVRESALLINVMGYLDDEEVLDAFPLRVFLDIDPGFSQMWHELGLCDLFAGHDRFVTIATNIADPRCRIPTCGIEWETTAPPVVLDLWPSCTTQPAEPITTVGSWRGPNDPVAFEGTVYGLRAHRFRQIAHLPTISEQRFQVALAIDSWDGSDRQLLTSNGWNIVDPDDVAGDPWKYRNFVQQSAAELMVAKAMYVQTYGGWFSDRSACYLASGRPVIAEDTGWTQTYPEGVGLLAFRNADDAAAAVAEVRGDYARHSVAAREVAETCFASDVVLTRLLEKLGVE
jgi:hypothetical protein